MKILGTSFSKVSIERKNLSKGKMTLKADLKIEDIHEEKVSFSDKPTLRFDFSFAVNYEPDLAVISIKGALLTLDDKGVSKEIMKEWKDKKFSHPEKIGILNHIMTKCNLRALQLEDEFNLPLHVALPKIKPADSKSSNQTNYTG